MKFFKNSSFILVFTFLLGVFPQVYFTYSGLPEVDWRTPASSKKTAYDIWGEMMEASVGYSAKATGVLGSGNRSITWGAEKEGSSSYITRLLGPNFNAFNNALSADQSDRAKFLKIFFTRWMDDTPENSIRVWIDDKGEYHDPAKELFDEKGRNKSMSIAFLNGLNPEDASLQDLEEKWQEWGSRTNNSPFSYLSPQTRRELFKGKFPYIDKKLNPYSQMTPIIGEAQKYIDRAEATSVGWEILFKPQKSFGEFQEMIAWFKELMGRNGELFQAPGHQRMVVPVGDNFNRQKAAELTKAAQALIVLEGIAGRSGIESADYKDVLDDWEISEGIIDGEETGRGPLRVDYEGRFVKDSVSIEFRSGTKNLRVARFIQASLASRFSRNDFSGIEKVHSWTLVDDQTMNHVDTLDIKYRFGLTMEQAKSAASKLNQASLDGYNVALWNWYNECPMFGKTKKTILKNLTKDYLIDVASLKHTNRDNLKKAIISLQREWVASSNIIEDIRKYMMPQRNFLDRESFHKFKPGTNLPIDVNKIDLGIEYSAKFPLKFQGDYAMIENEDGSYKRERLLDGKMSWLQTRVDMSADEKEAYLEKLATDLRDRLGGEGQVERLYEDGHGHGLDIAFKIRDSKDRSWRVEWDGIGRNYTPAGDVIIDSVRAGSIEVVTPKFEPNMDEIQAVFDTFQKNNALPYIKAGGGHLNIDLTVFENKPYEFARFLAIFNEYRSVIAFMFQDLNRVKSAEPVVISDEFAKKLANWNGTETELKMALYNEGYFNKRVGRKARYTHLDVSAYFQDVIPEKFISDDFDISNPKVPWRPAFRVNPKIRKAEVRLMNAPRDAYESALQMKLFRAILNKALNTTSEISGTLQNISHERYLNNYARLIEDLKKMTDDLGLEMREYRPIIGEGLANVEQYTSMKFYRPLKDQLVNNPVFNGWEKAVRPRGKNKAITSEARAYTGPIYPEALEFQELRIESSKQSETYRTTLDPNFYGGEQFTRKTNCAEAIKGLIAN
ncbi:hypothetical protein M902_2423 [Bacteriovorax sp. BAL6_X]|uniref:hypothetical protein n=1 Tax=Bacteriovorax sp. BAL6_X TaxID=1201290 RepID=UPI0003865087|nr:hypothetical protein [Bacteriovorax sp. BAL6_X]EPZ52354.1 hypothetical protein M902_2423 [Bacteriovorax sp. BAL6_X]